MTQCVLLSIRFPLSPRAVEEMMLLRGVQISYETIRRWRTSLANSLPMNCADDGLGRETNGAWIRCF